METFKTILLCTWGIAIFVACVSASVMLILMAIDTIRDWKRRGR